MQVLMGLDGAKTKTETGSRERRKASGRLGVCRLGSGVGARLSWSLVLCAGAVRLIQCRG